MQRVTVLCVGKLKEKFYLEAAAEYVKRLQRFCKLELVELPESAGVSFPGGGTAGAGGGGGVHPGKAPQGRGSHRPVHRGKALFQRGAEPSDGGTGRGR